jgi:HPt (histidine-containing phosphotransfer) domain-containing protein
MVQESSTLPSGAAAIDRDGLSSLIGTAPDDFRPLLALCERDFPKAMSSLRAAVVAGDAAKARAAAHGIKGILLNLCAARGSALTAEVEELVAAGGFAAAAPRVDRLDAELRRVTQELRAFCVP